MNQGTMKANAVAVGEITADFLPGSGKIRAKAAFVNVQTGKTHGWTEQQSWSPNVLRKLEELKAAMEDDLAQIHLEGFAPMEAATSPTKSGGGKGGGLGEHLTGGGDDAAPA